MRNAEVIHKRLDAIKQMKSYTEALTALADIQYDIGMEACSERVALRKEVETLRTIILGNGHPEDSLLSRLKSVEDCIGDFTSTTKSDITIIKNALIGTIDGKKGIIDRLEQTEKMNANITKIVWLIVTVVIGEFLARLIGLF